MRVRAYATLATGSRGNTRWCVHTVRERRSILILRLRVSRLLKISFRGGRAANRGILNRRAWVGASL